MKYTCGFMIDRKGRIALVEKTKPAWQAGWLNGIGGKLEEGESSLACMRREWKEETGHAHDDWEHIVTLLGENSVVYFYRAIVDEIPLLPLYNDSSEMLVTIHVGQIGNWAYVPNLRWLVPLAQEYDWKLSGEVIE